MRFLGPWSGFAENHRQVIINIVNIINMIYIMNTINMISIMSKVNMMNIINKR